MMKAVIIDDDKKNISILKSLFEQLTLRIEVAGEAGSADEAGILIPQLKPDLVFLDIEMPYGNAFDLLDKLAPVSFEVVFITAFNNYAIKAFRYAALDYILKPVNIHELQEAVKKVNKRQEEKTVNTRINSL